MPDEPFPLAPSDASVLVIAPGPAVRIAWVDLSAHRCFCMTCQTLAELLKA